jgi:hypothetical protein
VRTDELIVQLARAAGPVHPLPSPSARLARWIAVVLPITALGVIVMHPRVDLGAALQDPRFVGRALATVATALLSAASAFVLSVPGAERSPFQRAVPLLAGGLWALVLTLFLIDGGNPVPRLATLPFNPPCIYQIIGLSVVPGLALFAMLRRAAPLQPAWSAALATLAAAALSAAGTQMICPVDDPAHQLVGHVVPVIALTVIGGVVGRPLLDWLAGIRETRRLSADV